MPEHMARRIPAWASTQRGRIILAAFGVLALTGWAAVFSLIVF
ncbi:hypothetical protein [Citricoccus sp.]|nr:hypothetical protein [Citricoccus sp.]HRO31284.1 hypothetical protein [Citricoccus sp.]